MKRTVAHRLVAEGRVQGVGFRASVREEARRLGLVGTVSNRADGAVEVLAQGNPEDVEAFEEFCRRGPGWARVETLRVFVEPPLDGLISFRVVR